MKTKTIVVLNKAEMLERKINDFLETENIDLVDIKLTSCVYGAYVMLVAIIIYKENKVDEK